MKPTLKPPVVEILIFTEKIQMFQINGDLDICGEKMTNMRSVLPYSEKMRNVPRQVWVESSNIIKTFLESKPFEQYFFINIKLPTS